jgi:hypothetical protein
MEKIELTSPTHKPRLYTKDAARRFSYISSTKDRHMFKKTEKRKPSLINLTPRTEY